MNLNTTDYTYLGEASVKKRTVIQKTYALLAVSFLPCILGVMLSMVFNPLAIFTSFWSYIIAMFAFFYGMCFLIEKNRYSKVGIAFLMFFTFGMGVILAPLLGYVMASSAIGDKLIIAAALMTASVFGVMAFLAKRLEINMSSLSSFLMIGGIVLMVGVVTNLFLQLNYVSLAIAGGFVIFSSLLMMWQIKNLVDGGEDSYISAALTLFVAIYNLFTSLLRILMAFFGDD